MSKSDTFFQFPIGALRIGEPLDAVGQDVASGRINAIIDFCLLNVGRSLLDDNPDRYGHILDRVCASDGIDETRLSDDQLLLYVAADVLNVSFPSPPAYRPAMDRYREINSLAKASGKTQVRLRANLLWDARDGQFTWRELAVLCGIYAGVGAAQAKRLSYARISTLSVGYDNREALKGSDAEEYELSPKRMRATVAKLHQRGLFVAACPNGRHRWYSNRLSMDGLIDYLAEREAKRIIAAEAARVPDEIARRTAAKLRELKKGS